MERPLRIAASSPEPPSQPAATLAKPTTPSCAPPALMNSEAEEAPCFAESTSLRTWAHQRVGVQATMAVDGTRSELSVCGSRSDRSRASQATHADSLCAPRHARACSLPWECPENSAPFATWNPEKSFRLVRAHTTIEGDAACDGLEHLSSWSLGADSPAADESDQNQSLSDRVAAGVRRLGTSRVSSRLSKNFGRISQFALRRHLPVYTSREFEQTIYDIRKNVDQRGLLSDRGMFCNDVGEKDPVEDEIMEYGSPARPPKAPCVHFASATAGIVDLLMLMVVAISSMIAPLIFLFGGSTISWDRPGSQLPGGRWLLGIDVSLDALYIVYLLWQLNVSILDTTRYREIARRRRVLRWRWRSGRYWISWFSALPSAFVLGLGAPPLLSCLKVARLHHVFYLPDSLWKRRDGTLLRLSRLIVLLMLCSHWAACLLGHLGGYSEAASNEGFDWFETDFDGSPVNGQLSMYVMVFVEAIHMLTGALDNPLGAGSVRDHKFGSLIIVAVFCPVGCVVISLFISTVVREHQKSCALSMKHEENMAFMMRALQTLNIPKGLQKRVFALHHFQRMAHDRQAFEALFNGRNLSSTLQSALRVYLYHDNMLCSKYFNGKDINYVLEIIRVLNDEIFLPGDYLCRRGEVGYKMFFLVRGQVSVLVPDPTKDATGTRISRAEELRKLSKGAYFGEVALIRRCVRTAWVRADDYVMVASLAQEDFRHIQAHFPEACSDLVKSASDTVEADQQRDQSRVRAGTLASFSSSNFDASAGLQSETKVQRRPCTAPPGRIVFMEAASDISEDEKSASPEDVDIDDSRHPVVNMGAEAMQAQLCELKSMIQQVQDQLLLLSDSGCGSPSALARKAAPPDLSVQRRPCTAPPGRLVFTEVGSSSSRGSSTSPFSAEKQEGCEAPCVDPLEPCVNACLPSVARAAHMVASGRSPR